MNTRRTPGPWRAADYMARAELIEGPEGQPLAKVQDAARLLKCCEHLLTIIDRNAPHLAGMMEYHAARVAVADATRPGSWGNV